MYSSSSHQQACMMTEQEAIDIFHTLLQKVLISAKNTGIISKDDIVEVDPNVVLAAPALTLLQGIKMSRIDGSIAFDNSKVLNSRTCPDRLKPIYEKWLTVHMKVRSLSNSDFEKLKNFLAGKDKEVSESLNSLATVLNGLAIQISQRHTFQNFFQQDINTVASSPTPLLPIPASLSSSSSSSPSLSLSSSFSSFASNNNSNNSNNSLADHPIISSMRETLYASMGEALQKYAKILTTDGKICDAGKIIAVGIVYLLRYSVTSTSVTLVRNINLTQELCPALLKPLLDAVLQLHVVKTLPERDINSIISQLTGSSSDNIAQTFDIMRLAVMINILAQKIVQLPGFKERAPTILPVLQSIASTFL